MCIGELIWKHVGVQAFIEDHTYTGRVLGLLSLPRIGTQFNILNLKKWLRKQFFKFDSSEIILIMYTV